MKPQTAPAWSHIKRRPLFQLGEQITRGFLTPLGCVLATLTLLTGATAGSRGTDSAKVVPIIYCVSAFCAVFFGLACIMAFLLKPRLQFTRLPVAPTTAGEDFEVEVEVINRSNQTAYDLDVLELNLPVQISQAAGAPVATIARLEANEVTRARVRLHARQRGSFTLKRVVAGTAYPFGICRGLRRSRQQTTFLVYPAFTPLEQFHMPETRRYQPGGVSVSSKVGESAEFLGTREYRHGDNIRHIHWASWARVGKPIIKQYHEEFFVRLAVVIDTQVKAKEPSEAFETGISLTAGIADFLSRRDYLIDIFAAGTEVFHFQSGRALAHFENILEILACLDSTPKVDWMSLTDQLAVEAPKLSALIVVLLDWNPERERLVKTIRALGVGVRVLVVSNRPGLSVPPGLTSEEFTCVSF